MKNKKDNLLIISLDAMADEEIEILKEMPTFKKLLSSGILVRDVESIFLTNTYPVHTSVITGSYPNRHGVIENKEADPRGVGKPWYWFRKSIKMTTLYDEGRKKGLKTASLLWPVTAKAKIKYNIPEIRPYKKCQNQVTASLATGSVLTTAYSFIRFGRKLIGENLNYLDDFSTYSMVSLIKRRKPNLNLIHLLAIDINKHKYGVNSKETINSIKSMDEKIKNLTEAMEKSFGEDYNLIIFSDHASLDVDRKIDMNEYLKKWDYITPDVDSKNWEAWFRNCGGTAFLYTKGDSLRIVKNIRKKLEETIAMGKDPFIDRILNNEELDSSGFKKESALGIEAKRGANFLTYGNHHGNHGYSNKMSGYKVFYFIKGKDMIKDTEFSGGFLLDIAPLSCFMLGIDPWPMDGKLRIEFIK